MIHGVNVLLLFTINPVNIHLKKLLDLNRSILFWINRIETSAFRGCISKRSAIPDVTSIVFRCKAYMSSNFASLNLCYSTVESCIPGHFNFLWFVWLSFINVFKKVKFFVIMVSSYYSSRILSFWETLKFPGIFRKFFPLEPLHMWIYLDISNTICALNPNISIAKVWWA